MRVIAGKARRLSLKTPKGMDTRPTQDRIKETLFNMLQPELSGCRFLDLFAGSGAIGIEALSRGASSAYFVEKSAQALAIIRENLAFTHLADNAILITKDVFTALSTLNTTAFDLVFMDPPYNKEYERKVLELLSTSSLINNSTLIIVEASLETDFSYLQKLNYTLEKEKIYKTNKHLFIRRTT